MKLKLVKGSEKPGRNRGGDNDLEDDVNALFTLPLAEFTDARNTLAARLKKSGRSDEAALVKTLAKPPVSAWAINQLYWNYRETFEQLLASGERSHKMQASGKVADLRAALDSRREALTDLSDRATSLLRDAGHNPSLDIIRRITSTLEAMSAMSAMSGSASRSDAPRPGRLTHDVDPPGFESLASWIPPAGKTQEAGGRKQTAGATSLQTTKPISNSQRKLTTDDDARRDKETRKAKIAAAKVSLQDAKRSLTEARSRTQNLEAARRKADAEVKKADQRRRDAEQELRKAKLASEDAAKRARSVASETGEAEGEVVDAERTVDKASKELEALVRG